MACEGTAFLVQRNTHDVSFTALGKKSESDRNPALVASNERSRLENGGGVHQMKIGLERCASLLAYLA